MGCRAENDEHMPDGVVESVLFVLAEKIRPDCVERAFHDDPPERHVRHMQPHRPEDQQRHPTHCQIECQGQVRVLAESDELTDRAGDHAAPKKTEQRPTDPTAYDGKADERVRTGDHDVDRYMIEDPQPRLVSWIRYGVVEGGGEEHQQHAE